MTPPTITDLADWIGTDPDAARRAWEWTLAGVEHAPDWRAWHTVSMYALGHLHALERLRGYPVPR